MDRYNDHEILHKQLDPENICSLCEHAMYDIEIIHYSKIYHYYQCSACLHKVYPNDDGVCHCTTCLDERKKITTLTKQYERQTITETPLKHDLEQMSFIHKLFLLSILEHHLTEDKTHREFFDWDKLKYTLITPTYYYQSLLLQQCLNLGYIITASKTEINQQYYLNLTLDHQEEPSLYAVYRYLMDCFSKKLSHTVPFKQANEVQSLLYELIYHELIQYIQYICQSWSIQFLGNKPFETLCYKMMQRLSLSQLYYLVERALNYLYKNKLLQAKNQNFINTNLLKKTLYDYYQYIIEQKWETGNNYRPKNLPISTMSSMFFITFLNLNDDFYYKPVWAIWKNIAPRLNFYEQRQCTMCGSDDVIISYDQNRQITLYCQQCHQQNYYFF